MARPRSQRDACLGPIWTGRNDIVGPIMSHDAYRELTGPAARALPAMPCIMSTMDGRLPLETILDSLREMLPTLRTRYLVREIGLFGSYVRQGEHSGSDLDVLVTFDEPPSLLRFLELENLLADRLGLPVDLVMRDALKPRIGSRILRDLVPV